MLLRVRELCRRRLRRRGSEGDIRILELFWMGDLVGEVERFGEEERETDEDDAEDDVDEEREEVVEGEAVAVVRHHAMSGLMPMGTMALDADPNACAVPAVFESLAGWAALAIKTFALLITIWANVCQRMMQKMMKTQTTALDTPVRATLLQKGVMIMTGTRPTLEMVDARTSPTLFTTRGRMKRSTMTIIAPDAAVKKPTSDVVKPRPPASTVPIVQMEIIVNARFWNAEMTV